jgi:hypothetical protein
VHLAPGDAHNGGSAATGNFCGRPHIFPVNLDKILQSRAIGMKKTEGAAAFHILIAKNSTFSQYSTPM